MAAGTIQGTVFTAPGMTSRGLWSGLHERWAVCAAAGNAFATTGLLSLGAGPPPRQTWEDARFTAENWEDVWEDVRFPEENPGRR